MKTGRTTRNLREACLAEARAVIAELGVEALSLREVARRLGVSHQAPYRHFPSRDHLLAEVVARAYAAFAAHLDARPRRHDPDADLRAMGEAYLGYALAHPLEYRLMFGTPLPDPDAHPEMMRQSRHAFALLRDAVARLHAARGTGSSPDLDAMYVWATVHGLASAMQGSVVGTLGFAPPTLAAMPAHVLGRIGTGLDGNAEAKAKPASRKRRQSSVRR